MVGNPDGLLLLVAELDDAAARRERPLKVHARGRYVGEFVDFENTSLLCYVRGPEGLIVELAERLDGAPG